MSLSGFIARHMLQPACRHSAPASGKMRSSPSASAWCRTCSLPGTTRARTPGGDLPALEDPGRRPQVLDPAVGARADEDDVDRDLADRRARAAAPCSRGSARVLASRERDVLRVGNTPVTSTVIAGFVPQVTWGTSAAASIVTWRSKRRRVVGSQRLPVGDGRVEARPLGANGRSPLVMYSIVTSSGAISPARAPASIDMLQIVIRPSIDRAAIAGP